MNETQHNVRNLMNKRTHKQIHKYRFIHMLCYYLFLFLLFFGEAFLSFDMKPSASALDF